MPFRPRPKQQEVLDYTSGMLGVSAVPGSGKTITLSALAAKLVASAGLEDDQEVLIVTLVNSAVGNFAVRVAELVDERGLLPNIGYRVRTLHGLAHDIVRERPALVGLSEGFQIVDERAADQIREAAALAWLRSTPGAVDSVLSPELDERRRNRVIRDDWPRLVSDIASNFIRQAKDLQVTAEELQDRLDRLLPGPVDLARMGAAIYADYQRALGFRGAVDFDDLVRLALKALQLDREYLERLHHRWPFILEDEAQDSSRLQERILRLLAGPAGNWVRVGDPNQAIYETFTTASPQHLRRFVSEPSVVHREMSDSGRSTQSIIDLANYLVSWTRERHPQEPLREALAPARITPAPEDDTQPNPADNPTGVHVSLARLTPAQETRGVVESLARWLPEHEDETVAVLVPRNSRGFEVAKALKARKLPHVELLRSTRSTREAAGAVGNVVNYLADPSSPRKLANVYRVWRRGDRDDEERSQEVNLVAAALRKCRRVEDFLWPRAGQDWLAELDLGHEFPDLPLKLQRFRNLVRRWQGATQLPIDQLLLTLAQDLFHEPIDLALAHRMAGLLRRAKELHPDWQLPELTQELAVIARNERRFLGLGGDDTAFDPEQHRGQVVVTTVHKAKGLEWDRVHLISVNNYDFPSTQPHDSFIAERWFVRDGLNLEAEALEQLEALLREEGAYEEGRATQAARLEYAAERLRLLYVGITRAKKELLITCNTGRRGDSQPAVPLIALASFWERRLEERQTDRGAAD